MGGGDEDGTPSRHVRNNGQGGTLPSPLISHPFWYIRRRVSSTAYRDVSRSNVAYPSLRGTREAIRSRRGRHSDSPFRDGVRISEGDHLSAVRSGCREASGNSPMGAPSGFVVPVSRTVITSAVERWVT